MSKPVLKIAIVEDNIELSHVVKEYLQSLGRFEIAGLARDGDKGLSLIRSKQVDVAIIDLVLPVKDGFFILEELGKQPAKPVCFVLSGISLEDITRKAFEKGADYFILKPFDLDILARRIDEVWEQKIMRQSSLTDKPNTQNTIAEPESFVLNVLHEIPIPNTLNGYQFLKTAILMTIEDAELMDGVTKRLYPIVAKRLNTSAQQVERAIRHALDSAWRKGGGRNFVRIVGYGDPNGSKPTNSAFISAVVELYHHAYIKD